MRRGQDPEVPLDDIITRRLWLEGDEVFSFRPKKEFFQDVVLDTAANRGTFHPVKEYLQSLKWDGKERIEDWLVQYGGAEDSEYSRTIGRLVLVAAVRRVKKPGCLFQEMLVLESPQGKEKSTVLKALCPNEEWFSDGLPLDANAQKTIEQTSGKWIIEVAELSGLKKTEIEHVKNFLSQTHDIARMAYDRMVTTRPRHFIMIGTTNSKQYLRDSTGNRRFWPIKTPQFDAAKIAKDRDQLWAEAAEKEKTGMSIRLPKHLWIVAEAHQEERRNEDPWEIQINQCLEDMRGRILTEDIWKVVGMFDRARRSQNDNIRIGQALARLGFERIQIRVGKKIRHGYSRAETDLEKKQFIKIRMSEDNEPEAFIESSATTQEWETAAPEQGEK
jgi:predicted P-loop ATPase